MTAARKDANGYFYWEAGAAGVFLRVYPRCGRGRPASEPEVRKSLEAAQLAAVDWAAVAGAVREAEARPVSVAPPQPVTVPQDGRTVIEVTLDRMAAYMRVLPPVGGRPLDAAAARSALAAAGVVFGIDEATLDAAVAAADPATEHCVARGATPAAGKDGEVRFRFRTGQEGRPAERADGGVDFRELGIVQNVTARQTLAVRVSATAGKPGSTVTGEQLTARPGREVQLTAGENVAWEGGDRLVASTDGHAVVGAGGRVSVLRAFELKGSVDLKTGNVSFVGDVTVRGDVADGMTIEASGDVQVGGHIGAATVKAAGDITVRGGINGQNRGVVRAGRNVKSPFIENVEVAAGQHVEAGEAIMHSHVTAGGSVRVAGRGLLVGGTIRARDEVSARTIGSHLATPTEIEVGVDPAVRLEHHEVSAGVAARERELDEAQKTMAAIQRAQQEGRPLAAGARAAATVRRMAGLRRELKRLRARLGELDPLMSGRGGRVRAADELSPGVRVTIGRAVLVVDDRLVAATLSLGDDGEISVGPY